MSQHHLKETTRLGLAAAKANLLPSSLLWITGIALVALYYNHQPTARFLDEVGVVKMAWAPWFAMISTAVFGSVVPWLAQLLFAAPTDRQKLRHLPWLFLFWAAQGFQIDLLYKFQDRLFGSELTVQTIVSKALVDEFVWVPFLAIPQIVMAYLVIEKDFSRTAIREALQRRSFIARAIPLMIANWVVWIPTCSMVYLFPLPLQIPLMNLVLGIWCLIITFFAQSQDA